MIEVYDELAELGAFDLACDLDAFAIKPDVCDRESATDDIC